MSLQVGNYVENNFVRKTFVKDYPKLEAQF
jgi:hypothetical protein